MRAWLARHRPWLAAAGLLLTPWPGPHVDSYLPVAGVLMKAIGDKPAAGFWVLAVVACCVGYAIWWTALFILGRLLGARRD